MMALPGTKSAWLPGPGSATAEVKLLNANPIEWVLVPRQVMRMFPSRRRFWLSRHCAEWPKANAGRRRRKDQYDTLYR